MAIKKFLPLHYDCTICVIGLGYVGLPLAVEISLKKSLDKNHFNRKVIGFDIDQSRIKDLNQNIDCTHEVKSNDLRKASIKFTSNEDLSSALGHTPTSTIGIANVVPNPIVGRTEFAGTLVTTSSMSEGAVGITLNATDVAGNSVSVNAVTDGSSVTIDNSAPSANYIRLSSSGAVNTYAKAGEVITLDFQVNEEISSISNITIFENAPDAITVFSNL